MNQKLIVIDGKTYNSVDEMPEDVRRNYESAMSQLGDSNKDGIPDMLENLASSTDQNKNGMPDAIENMVSNVFTSSTKVIVNGAEYNSLDELSPELRAVPAKYFRCAPATLFPEPPLDTSHEAPPAKQQRCSSPAPRLSRPPLRSHRRSIRCPG